MELPCTTAHDCPRAKWTLDGRVQDGCYAPQARRRTVEGWGVRTPYRYVKPTKPGSLRPTRARALLCAQDGITS